MDEQEGMTMTEQNTTDNEQTPELRPCPYCGKTDKVHIYRRLDPWGKGIEYLIRCDRLVCRLKREGGSTCKDREQAIERWNANLTYQWTLEKEEE